MRTAALVLIAALFAGSALAQHPGKRGGGGDGFRQQPGQFVPQDRGRDSARDDDRRDRARPPERMRPEERDKLRQDIEEANRRMERRR